MLLLQKCISINLVAWRQIFKQALKIPGDEPHSRGLDSVYWEHCGGGWGGATRGGGHTHLYPKSWHIGPHFAVHRDLCIFVSLMPTAHPGNQSPCGHVKDENTEAGKDSATPLSVKGAGPRRRERGFASRGIISHPAGGCGHLLNNGLFPEIAGS